MLTITVLEGDETGQELLEQSLRLLDPQLLGVELELERFDLSLENRRATANGVVNEAAEAMRASGFGIKAATVTPEGKDDVGSPNRILREGIDGKVIIRTGRRIPGVMPFGSVYHPISIVRMAVGDAYGAKQWREGEEGADDEVALRTERITRSVCSAVSEYAFRTAAQMGGKVYGGPKWTVSPVYEGMLKEEMDAAAARHPDVTYEPVLIDATYAGLITGAGEQPLVIPALNRDGDCLSDLVMPMFGSIAGSESVLLSFDADLQTQGGDGRGPARDRAGADGQGRGQPDGDDPRLRRGARLRRPGRVRGRRDGVAGDLRGDARGGRRRCAHARPRRALDDVGDDPGGHRPRQDEARGVGFAGLEPVAASSRAATCWRRRRP